MGNSNLERLLLEAEQALEQGETDIAQGLFEQVIQLDPMQIEALHALGIIAAQKRDYAKAQALIHQAIAHEPNNASYYNHLGNVLQAQRQWQAAIAAHETAIQLDPTHAESYNNLGNAYFKQQLFEQARDCYEKATHHRPDYLAAWYNLALIQQKQNDTQAAITSLKTILTHAENLPEVHFQLAKLYQLQQNYAQALDHYQKVLDRKPDFLEALYNLGTIYLNEQQYNLAAHYFERAAEIEARSPNLQYNLGIIAQRKGLKDQAIQHYKCAIELAPDMAEAHQNIANLYSELKQKNLAIQHYQEVLRLQPDNASVAYMLQAMTTATTHQPTPATAPTQYVKNLFDGYADYYDQHLTKKLQYQAPQLLFNRLKAFTVMPEQSWQIIDLGCGTGLCGELLKPYAKNLIGIDLSTKMLYVAKSRGIYDELIQGDIAETLEQKNLLADLIIAADVFIYIGDLAAIFEQAARLLNDHGLFAFTVELGATADYTLQPTARFAHSEAYIKRLTQQYQLTNQCCEAITLRKQEETLIPGLLVVLQKTF